MQRFSSSLQRIEGHFAALSAIDERTTSIMGRVNVVESQFAPILKKQEDMNDLLCQLADRVTAVEQSHVSHHRGSVGGGALAPVARSFATASTGRGWMCPVCRNGILMPALSLKGHIRKLIPGRATSSRPKCRWKDSDPLQAALVARFEGDSYPDRCAAFTRTFYAFLQAATSSSYTDTECSQLITSWLTAVLNGLPLPVLPHCSSSSSSRRRLPSSDTPSSST
jgi:hypothetical protein